MACGFDVDDDAPDVVIATRRAKLNPDVVSEYLDYGSYHFKAKARPVLDAASPLVGTLVTSGVEELIYEVSICAMYFEQ